MSERWHPPAVSLPGIAPFASIGFLVVVWQVAVAHQETTLLPGPWAVARAIGELAERGVLVQHVVASLFRVTWGYLLAVSLAVPLGLCLGWFRRWEKALNPLIQVFRPISPLAWIPLSILWFGVGDVGSVFLIFVACFFPLTVTAMNAVKNVPEIYLNAGINFGLSRRHILQKVVLPAVTSQLMIGMRIALGVAWLVVVASEMIAVSSGLGFLIVDARNAGNRYDLVVAGMVMIGLIGLVLDAGMRKLEKMNRVYLHQGEA